MVMSIMLISLPVSIPLGAISLDGVSLNGLATELLRSKTETRESYKIRRHGNIGISRVRDECF